VHAKSEQEQFLSNKRVGRMKLIDRKDVRLNSNEGSARLRTAEFAISERLI
jgi:hypothetical protein